MNTWPTNPVQACETVNETFNQGQFMKDSISRLFLPGAMVAMLSMVSACSPNNSSTPSQTSVPPVVRPASIPSAPATPVAPEIPTLTALAVKPATMPTNIVPTSPLAEVVRLAQAGVDESIIMACITSSSRTFNLDSGKIIYLTDLGVPTDMVTAMMQRDQYLQEQFAAAQAAQLAQPVQPAPPDQSAPAPEPAVASTAAVVAPPAPVTVNYLSETLSPYGSWVVVNGFGPCWRPTVCVLNSSWQPYCDRGRWVYSDCGWYWNSDYAWGATFHYGRWFRATGLGWCWYPDTVWAPSWVTWRYSNNYCGWAPLPPGTGCQAGVGIVYNGGGVSVGFGFGLGASCFTFVPTQYFCNYYPRNCCVPPAQCTQVYNNTTVINNYGVNNHTIVNHGIGVDHIAAQNHEPIHPVPVHDLNAGTAHGVYAHGHYGQPSPSPGANRPAYAGNTSAPAQAAATVPIHNAAPGQNWNMPPAARPQHNLVVASIPQRQMPAANYYSPPTAPAQAPAAMSQPGQPAAPPVWQPARSGGSPRDVTQNYSAPPQFHPAPAAVAAPQYSAPQHAAPPHTAPPHAPPANAPASSPGQPGGYHGGNPGGPPH